MLEDPRLWVTVAFVAFVALSYKKIFAMAAAALDERSAKIKSELDEARRLREEAENLLAEYRRKQAESFQEAEMIMDEARKDADILRAQAEQDIAQIMNSRMKQALDRIAQEETRAVAEVRNHVVDIALSASRRLLSTHMAALPQEEIVARALTDIEQKVH